LRNKKTISRKVRKRYRKREPWLWRLPEKERVIAYQTIYALESVGITHLNNLHRTMIRKKAKEQVALKSGHH